MEFFHKQTKIDFMGMSKWTATLSLLVSVIALVVLMTKGLNFGLDFTGGTQLELRYPAAVALDPIREQLDEGGFSGAKVAQYGSSRDIIVKIPNKSGVTEVELSKQILTILQQSDPSVELRKVEFVGSEVGDQLAEQGSLAVLVALFATMVYIALRFEYRFGLSAAVSLLHDPIVILGIFALFQIEFDLATLAGILAVIGYSLNDTIVVYDRVRENFRKVRKGTAKEIMNASINQTLSRTIMTSLLTLMVVVALYFVGGESLHGFSLSLIIGIIIGTYSSIFVAGALALAMGLNRTNLTSVPKETAEELP